MTTTLAHPFRIDANGAAVTLEQGRAGVAITHEVS